MPRSKGGYYAVKVGRDGPSIYLSWAEAQEATSGVSGARHKKFGTWDDALQWLSSPETPVQVRVSPFSSNFQNRPGRPTGPRNVPNTDYPQAPPLPYEPPPRSRSPSANTSPQAGSSQTHERPPFSRVDIPNTTQATSTQLQDSGPPAIQLSDEQKMVLEKVKGGQSLFFTGSAGTGKSVLMREIIRALREKHGIKAVAVTAPTGIAAVNVGGTTLHSFAGIGLGKGPVAGLAGKILGSKQSRTRWRQTRVLVTDEISMVDGTLFDKLEAIARIVRGNEEPFGGLQLVISGDFFQLPPVPDMHDGARIPIMYAFEAKCWKKCIPKHYTLTQVFRQKEQTFINMLNEMRLGQLSDAAVDRFTALSRDLSYNDGLEPSQLFPKKIQVERANNDRLKKLPGQTITYVAVDAGGVDVRGEPVSYADAQKLLERLVALKEVRLRIGAQVMLIQNLVQGHLVNGSLGKVINFLTPGEATETGTDVAEPQTQATQATQAEPSQILVPTKSQPDGWPVVRFANGRTLLVPPMEFSVVSMFGRTEAIRMQIPLICAWAISIHKSQGQTLERVKIDMGEIFEKGQAYVALSRATSLETLQIINFRRDVVMADSRVLAWSAKAHPEALETNDTDISFDDDDAFEDALEQLEFEELEMEVVGKVRLPEAFPQQETPIEGEVLDNGQGEPLIGETVRIEYNDADEDVDEEDEAFAMEAYYTSIYG